MRRIILILFLLITVSSTPAYPYWIWTPKTKKFINPKSLPKSTPKEQFEYAKSFYDIKKYEDAIREFRKVLKSYPKSFEASESQYYIGLAVVLHPATNKATTGSTNNNFFIILC